MSDSFGKVSDYLGNVSDGLREVLQLTQSCIQAPRAVVVKTVSQLYDHTPVARVALVRRGGMAVTFGPQGRVKHALV